MQTFKLGTLRDYVTVERATTTPDGLGGQNVAWDLLVYWWGDMTPVRSGDEQSGRLGRTATTEQWMIVGRYEPQITTLDRAVVDGRIMNIRSAYDPDGMHKITVLTCEYAVAVQP